MSHADPREFHLGDILSITTGRLVSPSHMDGIYDILNFMTASNLFTHQLPAATKACAEPLLLQHPDLRGVDLGEGAHTKESVEAWLSVQVREFGETRVVVPLPAYDAGDPIDSLAAMMRPESEMIIVEVGSGSKPPSTS